MTLFMWLMLPPRYENLNAKLKNLEDVVKAAVLMVATQIAMELLVRQTVSEIFQERATISVRPSPKVSKEIGEDLEIFSMKYVKDKPVSKMSSL